MKQVKNIGITQNSQKTVLNFSQFSTPYCYSPVQH